MTETAARKALKELLDEFREGVDDVRRKCKNNEEKQMQNKSSIEKHDMLIIKIEEKADTVSTFNKRLL